MKDMEENQGNVYREIFSAAYALEFHRYMRIARNSKEAARRAYMFAHLAAEEYLQIKVGEAVGRKL